MQSVWLPQRHWECFHCSGTRYGPFCENDCPKGCSNLSGTRRCQKESGECLDECEIGYFGKTCDKKCPKTCSQLQCEKVIGLCLLGCKSGYDGIFCEKEDDSESPVLPIIGLVIGVIGVIGVVALLSLHVLRRINSTAEPQNEKENASPTQNVYDGLELNAVSVETGQYSDLDTAEAGGLRVH